MTVEWYLLTLPPFCWFGGLSGAVGAMAVVQCMAVSTYMACVLKDLLSCPRPAPAACAVSAARQRDREKAAAGKAEPPQSPSRDPSALPSSPSAASLFDALPSSPSGAVLPGSGAKGSAAGARGGRGAGGADGGGDEGAAQAARAAVQVLEEAYRGEIEYGAPSMHTWCAFIMPAYSALAAAQVGGLPLLQRALFGSSSSSSTSSSLSSGGLWGWVAGLDGGSFAALLVALSAAWSCWVAWSRLYLGVHTYVDLALGGAAGGAVLGLWRLMGMPMALAAGGLVPYGVGGGGVSLVPDGGSGGVVWLAALALVYLVALAGYPRPMAHSTSYEYAVRGGVRGGWVGLRKGLGRWRSAWRGEGRGGEGEEGGRSRRLLLWLRFLEGGRLRPPRRKLGLVLPAASFCLPRPAVRPSLRPGHLNPPTHMQVIFLGAALGGLASINTRTSVTAAMLGLRPEMQHGADTAAGTRVAALRAALQAAVPPALRHPLLIALANFVFIAVFKEAVKAVLLAVLPRLFGLAPRALRRAWQPWAVHPSGCWRPAPQERAEVVATVEAVSCDGAVKSSSAGKGAAADGSGASGLKSRGLGQAKGHAGGDSGKAASAAPSDAPGKSKAERALARGAALVEAGVLMKTPKLPYDVDFSRKFLNYGIVVYAAIELRYFVWQLVGIEST